MKICPTCLRCYEDARAGCAGSGHSPLEVAPGSLRIGESYRLERLLHRGEAGTLFAARHLELDRLVAVHVISPQVADTEAADRFRRVFRALAGTKHPNLADVYDSGALADGGGYAVIELVEGETLRQLVDCSGALTIPAALEIGRQVSDALAAAHRVGVVHGDLTASDVVLTRELGRSLVKLVGFGAAPRKSPGPERGAGETSEASDVPSAPQRPPTSEPDVRSDVYGLGLLLYEMLTGQPPYDSAGRPTWRADAETPRPVQSLRPDLPEPLGWLVMQSIHKNPIRRQRSAKEISERLRAFQTEDAPSSSPPSAPVASEPAPPLVAPPEPAPPGLAPPAAAMPMTGRADSLDHAARPGLLPASAIPRRPSSTKVVTEPDSKSPGRRPPQRAIVYAAAIAAAIAITAALFWGIFDPRPRVGGSRSRPWAAARAADAAKTAPEGEILAGRASLPADQPTAINPTAAPSPASPAAVPTGVGARENQQIGPNSSAGAVSSPRSVPVPPAPADPRAEVRRALDGWIAATNAGDEPRFMSYYMPRVETFYLKRNVSSAVVRAEKRRMYDRARRIDIRAGAPEIRTDPAGRTATLRFLKRFAIESSQASRRGEVLQEMRWVKTGEGWKIVAERDAKVLR